MFNTKEIFSSFSEITKMAISTGDSTSKLLAEGMGTISILVNNEVLNLVDCLWVPKLNCNLISLLQLFRNQVTITRSIDTFSLRTNEDTLFHGKIENSLMKIEFTKPNSLVFTVVDDLWHKRLGHPGHAPVRAMGLPSNSLPCQACDLNKIYQLPFKNQFEHANHPLDCVHIDLVGPISPPSVAGSHYFLTVVDQATSFKVMCMLKNKSEAFAQFVTVKNSMENQHD
ncbi:hypothetical protein O181_119203 [Austropuccinia psidii MF-1]|uniref:Retrovirus-related Pol polyprotein from transposon TNT 1-94-like beta-barrel domain-containing protein n=1 Tax=Austropuccinia psidii MF-1 TaxID=1389203 RepID=A0A9Q3KDN5_9BASI|nr:hypothetical protein [Austropuccinia psidii MF-1]